jgi:hypothetical protein
MDKCKAEKFGQEWIKAWNDQDLDAILSHYSDDVEFYSPFIPLLKFNESGVIKDKGELRKYFELGLNAYPDLHFQLRNIFTGIDTLVLYYTSVNGRLAAEVFQLDETAKAVKVYCNYHGI